MAVGGAAYRGSRAIKAAGVVAFEDLGMEASDEFTVQDMPVTVAVDSTGESVHKTGPRECQSRIGRITVVVEDLTSLQQGAEFSATLQQRNPQTDIRRPVIVVNKALPVHIEYLNLPRQLVVERCATTYSKHHLRSFVTT